MVVAYCLAGGSGSVPCPGGGQGVQERVGADEAVERNAGGAVAEQPELIQVVLEQARLEVVLPDPVQAAQQLQQRDPGAGADVGCNAGRAELIATGRRVDAGCYGPPGRGRASSTSRAAAHRQGRQGEASRP